MRPRVSVEDYRAGARRRLPRLVFDYVDGGAESEETVRANREAFRQVRFRPRAGGAPATSESLEVTVLGERLSLPVVLAPCGGVRIVHREGDLAGVRAAGRAGTAFVLSAMSGHGIEGVVAAAAGPVWFQLYDLGGRGPTGRAVECARDAGVRALMITVDTAATALRERDRRNGLDRVLGESRLQALPRLLPFLVRARWLVQRLGDGLAPPLANIVDHEGRARTIRSGFVPRSLGWDDLDWIREVWEGPIVVKGVLTPDDAERALAHGVAALVVSNHGGRQLDGSEATLRALPEIVQVVGGSCDVLLDGGIRGGTDVLKALALGAQAVLIGRPWIYGLAAGGQRGVESVLELFRESLARNLTLLGCAEVQEVSTEHVRVPAGWLDESAQDT
jgi:L-lactate dehydrogenase (cytochrome)